MPKYTFPCGCAFDKLEYDKISLDCPAVWRMFADGLVKGCFQLESNLGRKWVKDLRPESVEHLGALVAMLRPGVLNAKDEDGVSVAEHYCRRKNLLEPVDYLDKCLEPILKDTLGTLIYQESTLQIAKDICGFTPQEADSLRKAMGKKLADLMAKSKIKFKEGAIAKKIINPEVIDSLWENIEKSNRYNFNHSHSIAYGLVCYRTAFAKAHFPKEFFTSYLRFAHEKSKPRLEIADLVNEAKLMDIDISGPDIRCMQERFHIDGNVIRFGLCDIKGVGQSVFENLKKVLDNPNNIRTWVDFLYLSNHLKTDAVVALISTGALDHYKISRTQMLYEYDKWGKLTEKEQLWCQNNKKNTFIETLIACAPVKKDGGGAHNVKRSTFIKSLIITLQNPPYELRDSSEWLSSIETELLGTSISASLVDDCVTPYVNCTCKEFVSGRTGPIILGVEIQTAREIITKKGKGDPMAFLTIKDASCAIPDVTVFPKVYAQFSNLLVEGNTTLLQGSRDKKSGQFIVDKVWQI